MQISNCKQWDSTLCISRLNFHSVLRLAHYYLVVTVLEKRAVWSYGASRFSCRESAGSVFKRH